MKKGILFVALTLLISVSCMSVFSHSDSRGYQVWRGFYSCEKDTLDAVFIGASNVYPFWNDTTCWNEEGFTVFPLAFPGMPGKAIKYVIEESRKTQTDPLFIVNLNTLKDVEKTSASYVHYLYDDMKFSGNKVRAINDICDEISDNYSKIEFYLPFVRFHSRWKSLTEKDFDKEYNQMKGSVYSMHFLSVSEDQSENFKSSNKLVELTDKQYSVVDDLLHYCDENDLRVLFSIVPQAIEDRDVLGQLNAMKQMIESRGYEVFDMRPLIDKIGISPKTDYYNAKHLNVHGSLKFTHFFSAFLKDKFRFTDKRDDDAYKDWNKAFELSRSEMAPYTLEFERTGERRDYSLEAPKITCSVSIDGIKVAWNEIKGAEEYQIYRKSCDDQTQKHSEWELLTTVGSDILEYFDQKPKKYDKTYYTVVPTRKEGGELVYGNFDYAGKYGIFILEAPELLGLEKKQSGIVIQWKEVKGADGYIVYRKVNGEKYTRIAEISADECTYSFSDDPVDVKQAYVYTVRGYVDINNERKLGSYDPDGLLNIPSIDSDRFEAKQGEEGDHIISWGQIDGIDHYDLYCKKETGDDSWELLKDNISNKTTEFIDKDGNSVYKLVAVIEHKGTVYEHESSPAAIQEREG